MPNSQFPSLTEMVYHLLVEGKKSEWKHDWSQVVRGDENGSRDIY